jgi:hypothetical protein
VSVIQDVAPRPANRRSLDFAKRIAVGSLQSWYLMKGIRSREPGWMQGQALAAARLGATPGARGN